MGGCLPLQLAAGANLVRVLCRRDLYRGTGNRFANPMAAIGPRSAGKSPAWAAATGAPWVCLGVFS